MSKKNLALLALTLQTLLASGNFIALKIAASGIEPMVAAFIRFNCAALFLLLACRFSSFWKPIPKKDHIKLFLLGFSGVCLNISFLFWGLSEKLMTSDKASLLYATTGALAYFYGFLLKKEEWSGKRFSGIIIALIGCLIVLFEQGLSLKTGSYSGWIKVFIAVQFWTFYVVFGKNLVTRYGAFLTVAWTMFYGALAFSPLGIVKSIDFNFSLITFEVFLALLYMIFLTSGAAFFLWYYGLNYLSPSQVGLFTSMQPPLTALLCWLIWDQSFSMVMGIGTIITILGISLCQKS